MAQFSIVLRKVNKEGAFIPTASDSFIGQKQSRRWVKNTYGERSTEYIEGHEFYYVKKPNRFGVIWVTKRPNYSSYAICCNGKGENIPFGTNHIVTKH